MKRLLQTLEELFWKKIITLFMYFRLLFCNCEKQVWIELILYTCCWKNWNDYYSKNVHLISVMKSFETFSVTNVYEKQ